MVDVSGLIDDILDTDRDRREQEYTRKPETGNITKFTFNLQQNQKGERYGILLSVPGVCRRWVERSDATDGLHRPHFLASYGQRSHVFLHLRKGKGPHIPDVARSCSTLPPSSWNGEPRVL